MAGLGAKGWPALRASAVNPVDTPGTSPRRGKPFRPPSVEQPVNGTATVKLGIVAVKGCLGPARSSEWERLRLCPPLRIVFKEV